MQLLSLDQSLRLRDMVPADTPLKCPLCRQPLRQDSWWQTEHWICENDHSYSNPRVLVQEMREHGLLDEYSTHTGAG